MNAIPIDFSLSNQAWLFSVPILLTLVGFSVFWFISKDSGIKRRFYEESDTNMDNTNHIFFTKVVGFLSMGLIPLVIMLILFPNTDLAYYGFTIIPETSMLSLLWIVLLSVAVIPLAYFSAKKPKNLLNYPQIRSYSAEPYCFQFISQLDCGLRLPLMWPCTLLPTSQKE